MRLDSRWSKIQGSDIRFRQLTPRGPGARTSTTCCTLFSACLQVPNLNCPNFASLEKGQAYQRTRLRWSCKFVTACLRNLCSMPAVSSGHRQRVLLRPIEGLHPSHTVTRRVVGIQRRQQVESKGVQELDCERSVLEFEWKDRIRTSVTSPARNALLLEVAWP